MGDVNQTGALSARASEKFEQALAIQPNNHKALANWGLALQLQVFGMDEKNAIDLLHTAQEKISDALKIASLNFAALYNGANIKLLLTHNTYGIKKQKLQNEADTLLFRAEDIKPGSVSYIFASVAAQWGEHELCKEWLQRAKDHGYLPDPHDLINNEDFASVRDQVWFRHFLASA